MTIREWKPGERLRHAGRPEWGIGSVLTAEGTVQDGKHCQRLTIRFDRAGAKTISTAFADLRPADEITVLRAEPAPEDDPLLKAGDKSQVLALLTAVPEAATDPFTSSRKRLNATLDLYRFADGGPGALLDWAAMQTGLKDPLSRFNRHELEEYFRRFLVNLDAHLKKLLRDIRRQEPALIPELAATARPAAKQAMRRVDVGR